jgi:hypothetical protein
MTILIIKLPGNQCIINICASPAHARANFEGFQKEYPNVPMDCEIAKGRLRAVEPIATIKPLTLPDFNVCLN